MELYNVRRRFQDKIDFFIPAKYLINIFHKSYSLQQDPLTSEKFLLYITSDINPRLEGVFLYIHKQPWIVYKYFRERSNKDMFEYQVRPANDYVGIKALQNTKSIMGVAVQGTNTDGNSTLLDGNSTLIFDNEFNCFVDSFDRKERVQPTAQAVDAFEQTFMLAQSQLEDYQLPFVLYYRGNEYKVMSKTSDYGIIKIRATRDL